MALKLRITTPTGAVFDPAWCRVESITVTRTQMTFSLRKYGDESGVPFFDEEGFSASYDASAGDPFTQAYAYLHGLPQFAGAVDADDSMIDPTAIANDFSTLAVQVDEPVGDANESAQRSGEQG